MATYYINPDYGVNGDGTTTGLAAGTGQAGAYNSMQGVTLASSNSYLWKRGTTDTLTSRILVNNLNTITFSTYYNLDGTDDISISKPIITFIRTDTTSGNWTEIDTNIWEFDLGNNYWRPPILYGLGRVGDANAPSWTERVNYLGYATATDGPAAFTANGQWDSRDGAATTHTITNIIEGNPTQLTITGHGYTAADDDTYVRVTGITGTTIGELQLNGGINGNWPITYVDANTISVPYNSTALTGANGSLNHDNALYVYNTENPITTWSTIYYSTLQDDMFRLINICDNITIKNLYILYNGIKQSTSGYSNFIIDNCIFDHCYTGITIWTGGTNSRIINNLFKETGNIGINPGSTSAGSIIKNNILLNTGRANCIGAIYGPMQGTIDNPCIIENNYVDTVFDITGYWGNEQRCYYLENDAKYVIMRNNYGRNAPGSAGIHVNAGDGPNWVYNNIIEDCQIGLGISDALAENNAQLLYAYNNVFNRVFWGININTVSTLTRNDVFFYNNICISSGLANSVGCRVDTSTDALAVGLVEDYNCYYGFITTKNGTTALGTSNITSDPEIDNNSFPIISSPCVGTGTTTFSDYDAYNRPKVGNGYHIGAVWPDINTSKIRRKIK